MKVEEYTFCQFENDNGEMQDYNLDVITWYGGQGCFNGTETAQCKYCDVTDTRVAEGSKTAHSFTNYQSNKNATCLTDGTKTAKCDYCNATDTQDDAGSKLAHSFEKGECVVCGAEDADYTDHTDTNGSLL